MTDPTTPNALFAVPTRGSDSGTWDTPVNANTTAEDGFLCGVATISLSNANVTLTAPSGVVVPSAGPFQSQNRILKFTGTLTASVTITLPLPGEYTIQNLTVGNFNVIFAAAGAGNVISTPPGSVMHIWNDGTNVYFVKNVIPGALTFLGGVSGVPSWIGACTIAPYLLCDGSIYNYSTYPALGNLYGSSFGGNGITTFGVEDLRGRVPLAYDGTGTRITTAGCGINGQTLGASGGAQNELILQTNFPNVNFQLNGTVTVTSTPTNVIQGSIFGSTPTGGPLQGVTGLTSSSINSTGSLTSGTAASGGSGTPLVTVQPSQVAGIWLTAT